MRRRRISSAPASMKTTSDRSLCKGVWSVSPRLHSSSYHSFRQRSACASPATPARFNVIPRHPGYSGPSPRISVQRPRSAKHEPMNSLPQVSVVRPSMNVWRLEHSRCIYVEPNQHGFFHEGGCYLVLRVLDDKTTSLHYWLGHESKENEREIIHEKAHETDETLDRAHIFSREVQFHESESFLRLFPDGIVYIEGRPKCHISIAHPYRKKLYVVQGRKFARASCNEPTTAALDPTMSVILDGFPRIYLWIGGQSDYISRMKAIQVARRIRNCQRKGKAHIVIIDDNNEELCKSFVKKLHNGCDNKLSVLDENFTKSDPDDTVILHRVNGDRVLYDMPLVAKKPLEHKFLTHANCYLLGTGSHHPLYVWAGNKSSEVDICNGISRGMTFAEHHGNLEHQSVCRLLEDSELIEFKSAFCDWREKPLRQPFPRSYSATSIGRVLLSRSDRRTLTKVSEFLLPHDDADHMGSTEIWKVKNSGLEPVPWDEQGIFTNSHCYVILHTCRNAEDVRYTLYYWLGGKSKTEDHDTALSLSLNMDHALDYQSVVVRVLDGKEPLDFFNVMHDTMIVYDRDARTLVNELQLYAITECNKGCMRVSQVEPAASSLVSSAAFVLLTSSDCFLWYGQKSGGSEREYAKHMLGYLCPDKMYTFEIIVEGKESPLFWEAIGGKMNYVRELEEKKEEKRLPRLVNYSMSSSGLSVFQDVHDFHQEDLCDQDIVVMDTFEEIFIWCGQYVDNEKRKSVAQIAKDYICADLAGRSDADVLTSFISQGAEPHTFTFLFKSWIDTEGYGGKAAYERMRKRVRQENAKINIDIELVDEIYKSQPKHSYRALLRSDLPPDVDAAHKEHHLSDRNFEETLGVTRFQFYHYPEWKQHQILVSARLDAVTGSNMTSSTNYSPVPRLSLDTS